MTPLREHLQWRRPVEICSRSGIESMGDRIQLALGIARQIRSLGQILAQQTIGILVGPALLGAVWIGKEHLDGEPLGQAFVFGHLFAPIVGQRLAERAPTQASS